MAGRLRAWLAEGTLWHVSNANPRGRKNACLGLARVAALHKQRSGRPTCEQARRTGAQGKTKDFGCMVLLLIYSGRGSRRLPSFRHRLPTYSVHTQSLQCLFLRESAVFLSPEMSSQSSILLTASSGRMSTSGGGSGMATPAAVSLAISRSTTLSLSPYTLPSARCSAFCLPNLLTWR